MAPYPTGPSITDWLISISSLCSIPLVFWGIIKIFRRNKEHDDNIRALTNLTLNQDKVVNELKEQVEQLQKQTSLFEYQANLMLESNKLLEKNLDLQIQIYESTQDFEEKKISLEEQKRISEIKPYFVFNGGTSGPQYGTIRLQNRGADAHHVTYRPLNKDNVNFRKTTIKNLIANKKSYEIKVKFKNPYGMNSKDFSFVLLFEDIDRNQYEQTIEKEGTHVKVNHPELKILKATLK